MRHLNSSYVPSPAKNLASADEFTDVNERLLPHN